MRASGRSSPVLVMPGTPRTWSRRPSPGRGPPGAKVRRYSAPRGWVVRSALNTGVSWWRPRRREIPLASHDAAALADPAGGLDAAVLAALRRLPARQREVIALRVFLDLDTQATAHVLGIAPGTVTAHLSRAAAALRREPALHSLVAPSHADTTHDGGQP